MNCVDGLYTIRSHIEMCLLGVLLAYHIPAPWYYSTHMIHYASTRYAAVAVVRVESPQETCDRLRAFSSVLKDEIDRVNGETTTMRVLWDSRPHLPSWLQRRKSREKQEKEAEAWRVLNGWVGGRYVTAVNEVVRTGECMVDDVERMLGIQDSELEVRSFCITWDHRVVETLRRECHECGRRL